MKTKKMRSPMANLLPGTRWPIGAGAIPGRLAKAAMFLLAAAFSMVVRVQAEAVFIPNHSFESPGTDFADPRMDAWQKAPEPGWYQGGGGFPWTQLMGQFRNSTNGSPDHIDNMDGSQAAFVFALPGVALFQDENAIGGTNTTPAHDFKVKFEAGKSYALTVGLLGGGGGMSNGATFQISLYYRDAESNRVTVAAASVTNSQDAFPTNTRFIDLQARTPVVLASDGWAGQNLGILLESTVGFDRQGGYWDLDHVRLGATQHPVLSGFIRAGNQSQLTLQSTPGIFEILAANDISIPESEWSSLGTVTNGTGSISFADTNADGEARFYRARQLP